MSSYNSNVLIFQDSGSRSASVHSTGSTASRSTSYSTSTSSSQSGSMNSSSGHSSRSSASHSDRSYRNISASGHLTNTKHVKSRDGKDIVIIQHNGPNRSTEEPRSSDYHRDSYSRRSS